MRIFIKKQESVISADESQMVKNFIPKTAQALRGIKQSKKDFR